MRCTLATYIPLIMSTFILQILWFHTCVIFWTKCWWRSIFLY